MRVDIWECPIDLVWVIQCHSRTCVEQRKHARPLPKSDVIYQTMCICTDCGTWWTYEQAAASDFDHTNWKYRCPCCGHKCRTSPKNKNARQKWQKVKAQQKRERELGLRTHAASLKKLGRQGALNI